MKRIQKGDSVRILTGDNKGQTVEVERVAGNKVYLKGINKIERHYRATAYNQGGKRDIQLPVDISNVALVSDDKTSRVSYEIKADKKVRVAKVNSKEIK